MGGHASIQVIKFFFRGGGTEVVVGLGKSFIRWAI